MKDQEFKDIWRSLEDMPGIPIGGEFSIEQFIKSRSITVKDKIRKMLQNDMLLKLIGGVAFLLNLGFYSSTYDILYICLAGLVFLAIMTSIEYKTLQQFNSIADPGQNTRENLSGIMVFLQRKSNIIGIITASTQVLVFVPGLLLYFYATYGQLTPMTGFSFFVFTTLCLIGTVMSYSRSMSQIKYHIKHLTICMSDLNEETLQMSYAIIEKERKHDSTKKILTGLLLVFAFVVLITILMAKTV